MPRVKLDESTHTYYDDDGLAWTSCSAFLHKFKPFFDRDAISYRMAKKALTEQGIANPTSTQLFDAQKKILSEWDFKTKRSQDHGKVIHKALEDYGNSLPVQDLKLRKMAKHIYETYFSYAHKHFNEQVLWLDDINIAGTADKPLFRNNSASPILDIADYKTNLEKGIEFYSKYGNRMMDPISHLEDCNYIHYALQLSIYMYMGEVTFGCKPGRMFIIYISPELKETIIHVPYLKREVEALIGYYKNKYISTLDLSKLKPLPVVNASDDDIDEDSYFD